MVDLSNRVTLYKRKPRTPLRDYDQNPLFIEIDGHTLKVTNNMVTHILETCPRCRNEKEKTTKKSAIINAKRRT